MTPAQDSNVTYWQAALGEFAKDCVGVGVDLRVPLKVESLSTIQRFVRATKEGITRPTRDMMHHSQAEMFWDCPPPVAPAPPPAPTPVYITSDMSDYITIKDEITDK